MNKNFNTSFPGTNCEKESLYGLQNLETDVEFLDLTKHAHLSPNEIDFIFIPEDFSFGDYPASRCISGSQRNVLC